MRHFGSLTPLNTREQGACFEVVVIQRPAEEPDAILLQIFSPHPLPQTDLG